MHREKDGARWVTKIDVERRGSGLHVDNGNEKSYLTEAGIRLSKGILA